MKTFRDLKVGEKAHVERQQSAVSSQHLALSPWRVGMKNFRDLKVWEKAHQVALIVYRCTASFPPEERFGLTAQMRRCAVSIGSNIAEGCGRRGNAELHKFLQFAMGSANELEYQWLLSRDLGYVAAKDYSAVQTLLEELKRMLSALIRKVDSERA